jgi:hypothetical protein
VTDFERHQWIKHDSVGRSKTCDRCRLRADRFGIGRTSYWMFSYPGQRAVQSRNVPPCPGWPDPAARVVEIPIATEQEES